nr:MAG: hypothetical protein [Lake Baikal virophage 12]
MSDNNLIQEFLDRVVCEETEDKDHWLLTGIYYRALPRKSHYNNYWEGYVIGATDTSVVYEWWSEYLETAVSNEFLRKFLEDSLYDEAIYHFLNEIHDKYETHIKEHYDAICNECGEESDYGGGKGFAYCEKHFNCKCGEKAFGSYGEENIPLCLEHKTEEGYCGCGNTEAQCDLCAEDE